MKNNLKWMVIGYGTVFLVLFVILKVFNCIYKTDYISVLFGVGLLAVSFVLHEIIDDIIMRHRLNKLCRKLEEEVDKLKNEYNKENDDNE